MDALGTRIALEKSMIQELRARAAMYERMAKRDIDKANEMERLLELARRSHG